MKCKPSISHDQATAKELRENPEFAVEYLRAALEEGDDPQILLVALRRIAESRGGSPKLRKRLALSGRAFRGAYRLISGCLEPRLIGTSSVMGTLSWSQRFHRGGINGPWIQSPVASPAGLRRDQ
jgi:DNA-binding phage protein